MLNALDSVLATLQELQNLDAFGGFQDKLSFPKHLGTKMNQSNNMRGSSRGSFLEESLNRECGPA